MPSRPQSQKVKQSIVDFLREKERAQCPVCTLPESWRQQLQFAREKGIRIADQVEFLRKKGRIKLRPQEIMHHNNKRHDDDEET